MCRVPGPEILKHNRLLNVKQTELPEQVNSMKEELIIGKGIEGAVKILSKKAVRTGRQST